MARLFLSLTDEEVSKFDKARDKAGMSRSQYLKFLLSGRRDIRPPVMQYRELIKQLSEIEKDVKIIAMKDSLSDQDRLLIITKLEDIKNMILDRFEEAQNG